MLDIGPVHVRGAIRARYARVIWKDGTLYAINRNGPDLRRQSAPTSEPVPPENSKGLWKAITDEGQSITFTQKGCSG